MSSLADGEELEFSETIKQRQGIPEKRKEGVMEVYENTQRGRLGPKYFLWGK